MKIDDNSKGWPEGWLIAAAAAIFSAVMARVVGDLGLFATVMIAIFVFLVFGVLLGMFWGGPIAAPHVADGHGHGHGHAHAPMAKAERVPDQGRAESHPTKVSAAAAPEAVATDDGMALAPPTPALMAEPGIAEEVAASAVAVEEATPMPAADRPAMAAPEAVATDDGMAQAPVAQALMADPAPIADMAPVTDMAGGTINEDMADADLDGDGGDDESDVAASAPATRRTKEERIAARAAKAARQASKAERAAQSAPVAEPVAAPAAQPAAVPMAPAMAPADPVPEGGHKPQGLSAARGGQPDKLQTIEGIGPALEKLCHALGVYHFDQIANWGPAEIVWMDGNLKGFKGRVTRDKWVRQAALIGEVGVDEFLRRARSNDY